MWPTWMNVFVAFLTRKTARQIVIIHYGVRAITIGVALAVTLTLAFCVTLVLLDDLRIDNRSEAQGTGGSFTTPDGQVVSGMMVLVPCGPVTSGQPSACPNGAMIPMYVTCTNCSPSAPIGASSNPVNGAIATTNTFQTLITQNSSRRGCTFQNQGSHNMYFSVASSPTLANSLIIPPNGIYNCSGSSNVVLTDTVQVTGTSGDSFAGQWQ